MTIKVGVIGAMGKMGKEVVKTVINDPETELVCAVDKFGTGESVFGDIKVESDIKQALERV